MSGQFEQTGTAKRAIEHAVTFLTAAKIASISRFKCRCVRRFISTDGKRVVQIPDAGKVLPCDRFAVANMLRNGSSNDGFGVNVKRRSPILLSFCFHVEIQFFHLRVCRRECGERTVPNCLVEIDNGRSWYASRVRNLCFGAACLFWGL